jgi:hypothetical protein
MMVGAKKVSSCTQTAVAACTVSSRASSLTGCARSATWAPTARFHTSGGIGVALGAARSGLLRESTPASDSGSFRFFLR